MEEAESLLRRGVGRLQCGSNIHRGSSYSACPLPTEFSNMTLPLTGLRDSLREDGPTDQPFL